MASYFVTISKYTGFGKTISKNSVMLRKEYYCLVAGLPDLFFNESKLTFNCVDFREELQNQLSCEDYNLLEYLFLPFDNENLLSQIFEQSPVFNPNGNISKAELEFQFSPENELLELPAYMIQFLNWVQDSEINERTVETENILHQYFYEYALQTKNEFLRSWFTFNLNIKNIFAAFNCVRFGYNLQQQLIKVEQNIMPYSLLINKRLKPELFEDELPFNQQIFRIAESDISLNEKEKELDKIRWNYLDENTFFHYFTIEKILSFTVKMLISDRWLKLDADTGKILLKQLIDDLKTSYEFPMEFSLSK